MRTEVKIASIIVLAVLVIGIAWYVWFRTDDSPDIATNSPDNTEGSIYGPGERADPGPSYGVDTGPGAGDATDGDSTSGEGDAGDTSDTGAADTGTTDAGDATTDDGADDLASTGAGDSSLTDWDDPGSTPPVLGSTDPPTTYDSPPSYLTTPPMRTVYTVKDGDSYWGIAKDLYDDGSLYWVLVKANPNIPAMSLRKGMTIKVPPKPAKTMRTSGSSAPTARHGAAETDALTGRRYYVVKKGDNGFWGVSMAVFKTGKHYQAIQALNPGVDSSSMRPGQKIRVPAAAPARAAPRPRTVRETPARPTRTTAGSASDVAVSGIRTGAPARSTLPSGAIFD